MDCMIDTLMSLHGIDAYTNAICTMDSIAEYRKIAVGRSHGKYNPEVDSPADVMDIYHGLAMERGIMFTREGEIAKGVR